MSQQEFTVVVAVVGIAFLLLYIACEWFENTMYARQMAKANRKRQRRWANRK